MEKKEFQRKMKILKGLGIIPSQVAKKIDFSESQVKRAKSDKWKGDCSRVYWAFNKVFK